MPDDSCTWQPIQLTPPALATACLNSSATWALKIIYENNKSALNNWLQCLMKPLNIKICVRPSNLLKVDIYVWLPGCLLTADILLPSPQNMTLILGC